MKLYLSGAILTDEDVEDALTAVQRYEVDPAYDFLGQKSCPSLTSLCKKRNSSPLLFKHDILRGCLYTLQKLA